MLERFLLGRNGFVELKVYQAIRRRYHGLGSALQALDEGLYLLIDARELAGTGSVRQRARLLGQRSLELGQHLRVVLQLLLVLKSRLLFLLADQVPGGKQDFLLPLGDLVLLLAAATAATAAALHGLRIAAIEGLNFDEEQVGALGSVPIMSFGVIRNEIARLEARRHRFGLNRRGLLVLHQQIQQIARANGLAELLQIQNLLAERVGTLDVQGNHVPFATVDRIVQLESIQTEVIGGLYPDRDFLDIAGPPVSPGPNDFDHRFVVRNDIDEIIVRQAHGVFVEKGGDVILTVFFHFQRSRSDGT